MFYIITDPTSLVSKIEPLSMISVVYFNITVDNRCSIIGVTFPVAFPED